MLDEPKIQATSGGWFEPSWDISPNIKAVNTLRFGGNSEGKYSNFNLASHVDDEPTAVKYNRRRLMNSLNLPHPPCWLEQIHGAEVVRANVYAQPPKADASYCNTAGFACAVMTADCLPILLASNDGEEVAALHAGWRGLHVGVIARTLSLFKSNKPTISAWLGPRICKTHYQVGRELLEKFTAVDNAYRSAFSEFNGHYHMSLCDLATWQLHRLGVQSISDCGYCTYGDKENFFSYRRDGVTGRTATLIWRTE